MESRMERTMATTTIKNEDELAINIPPEMRLPIAITICALIVIALLMSSVADTAFTESAKKFCASYNETYLSREGNLIHCQQGLRVIDRRVQPTYSK